MGTARAGDPPPGSPPPGIFIYTISRDGEPIGQQRLEFVVDGNKLRVISHTDLDVRFMGMNLYGFNQQVEEVRADGRIVSLTSEADDDGTDKKVDLALQSGRLKGEFNGKAIKHDIDPSLTTSLFWQQPPTGAVTVLDCLRGKARDVTVSDLGAATLDLPVGRVQAHHLRVAGDIARELWYDAKGILVAGQVTAKDGSTVRQELQQRP
ncbi:MAG TPA: DUF6134 family protein [Candidatus Binatia bacterium]|nr:DUF6134 family protein [Candidatus Binatia bacterium]